MQRVWAGSTLLALAALCGSCSQPRVVLRESAKAVAPAAVVATPSPSAHVIVASAPTTIAVAVAPTKRSVILEPGMPASVSAVPIELPEPAGTWAHDDSATPLSSRLLAAVQDLEASVKETRYDHSTFIDEKHGIYRWDCSVMTSWLLMKVSPVARKSLYGDRPLAKDYVDLFKQPRKGWQSVATIGDVHSGDLFAWRRPKDWGPGVTGHVGFVVATPKQVGSSFVIDGVAPGSRTAYVIRIADATSFGHGNDTRPDGTRGGFGLGDLLILVDETGHGTHYGWFGARSDAVVATPIYFARLSDS